MPLTLSKSGSNFTAFLESTNTIVVLMASSRLFPNHRWLMRAWKTKTFVFILKKSYGWNMINLNDI